MQVDDGPNLTMESINSALSGEILARTTTWHSQIANWHRQIAPNTPHPARAAAWPPPRRRGAASGRGHASTRVPLGR